MKFYKHSDGSSRMYPEIVLEGWSFIITPDFQQIWRKIK